MSREEGMQAESMPDLIWEHNYFKATLRFTTFLVSEAVLCRVGCLKAGTAWSPAVQQGAHQGSHACSLGSPHTTTPWTALGTEMISAGQTSCYLREKKKLFKPLEITCCFILTPHTTECGNPNARQPNPLKSATSNPLLIIVNLE